MNIIGELKKAVDYHRVGQLDKAREIYMRLNAEAYFDLGNAYQQLNRFNDAIAAYQSALKINPLMAEAHNNLGVALFNSDQVEEALSHYQRALQLRTEYVEAYINAGNALKKQERFTEALLW